MTQAPAGWYPQEDGRRRYWDGSAWTEHVQPGPVTTAAGHGSMPQKLQSLVTTTAEPDPDAVWQATGKPITGLGAGRYKLTRHYLFVERGVLGTDSQQVPIVNVVDVDVRQTLVQKSRNVGRVTVHVQGPRGPETIVLEDISEFREAQRLINQTAHEARLATQRNANTHRYETSQPITTAAPVPPAAAVPAATAEVDPIAQLRQLGELRDAGILTEEEFAAKKSEILSRL
jgi:hypothetical protein